MRNLLMILFVVAVGAGGYFLYSNERLEAERSKTPEAQLDRIVEEASASADTLARVCEEVPALAYGKLRNRLITVRGSIDEMRLVGVAQTRAELFLRGNRSHRVRMVFDLKKYNTLAVQDQNAAKYAIVGHELLYFRRPGAEGKVIFRRGQEVTERGRFVGVGGVDVAFNVE